MLYHIVEPEAASVVRRIYGIALEGYGQVGIAAALEQDGINNPTYYWQSKDTPCGGYKSALIPTKWGHTTLRKILGCMNTAGMSSTSKATPSHTR